MNRLFFILSFLMGVIVLGSNYLVQFPVQYYGLEKILTYGAFSYPIAFLITDLANRSYGKIVARKVVYLGFVIGKTLGPIVRSKSSIIKNLKRANIKGDIEKISYFLSGEIKWYNLDKLFYPINILHYVLNEKLFYFTNDILTKLFAYFSFYLLAKSLGVTKFNSALGGVLYSSLIYIKIPLGLALPFLPYILYLLLNYLILL